MTRYHATFSAFLFTLLAGCTEVTPPARPPSSGPAAELGQCFDAAATGTIEGRIVWQGPIPSVPPFDVHPELDSHPNLPPRGGKRANPHAPHVNADNRGVAQAVVFLRSVDLRRSRPWDHGPVLAEHDDWEITIVQGPVKSPIGFVRRGEDFQTVNRQNALHILRGDGAAYFSMPLPEANVLSKRTLEKTGHVELSSGADCYWMRAHLFVDDHPYYVRSDAEGRFVLPSVPAGSYQVVCWLPSWHIARRERNAEVGVLGRVAFCRALERETTTTVIAGKAARVEFSVAEDAFEDCGPRRKP